MFLSYVNIEGKMTSWIIESPASGINKLRSKHFHPLSSYGQFYSVCSDDELFRYIQVCIQIEMIFQRFSF